MRVLRRGRTPRLFGRLDESSGSRDVGEAVVGNVPSGIPMIAEDGTLGIGRVIAGNATDFALTPVFEVVVVYGIPHAVGVEFVDADRLRGTAPVRLVIVPVVAGAMAIAPVTIRGRVEWAAPPTVAGEVTVTAVGASLGDVLPGT